MTPVSRLITVNLLLGCLLLQGCHSVKTSLGIDRDPPDEFAVLPNSQPLDMPPDFYKLPVPVPGCPRPQEIQAAEAKKEEIFGAKPTGHSSKGQKEILKLGGAHTHHHKKIREDIDAEAEEEALKKRNHLLEMVGVKQQTGDIVDPQEEAKNLETQGIPQRAPIHTPNAN